MPPEIKPSISPARRLAQAGGIKPTAAQDFSNQPRSPQPTTKKSGPAAEPPDRGDRAVSAAFDWTIGGLMIGVALFFDALIALLAWTVIGLIATWIISLFAFMTFTLWLILRGQSSFGRIALLLAPLASGCVGLPGWAATIWPLVAKIIGAKTLGVISPAAGQIAGKLAGNK